MLRQFLRRAAPRIAADIINYSPRARRTLINGKYIRCHGGFLHGSALKMMMPSIVAAWRRAGNGSGQHLFSTSRQEITYISMNSRPGENRPSVGFRRSLAMPMVCPRCNRSFDQQLQCPDCDTRLLYHAHLRSGTDVSPSPDAQWQHTPWGRILVGVVLAQGLAQGLQLFFLASLQASGDPANRVNWDDPAQVILLQALHGFSLLLGGVVAGASQRRGVFYGSVVGLLHGLLTLGIRQGQGDVLPQITLCAVPALHMAFGAVGGLLGSLIWRPLPTIQLTLKPDPNAKPLPAFSFRVGLSVLAGPVAWLRVTLGVALAAGGVLCSSAIFKFVLDNAPARLQVESVSQFQLFSCEVASLITFLAAAFAGATTTNGLKQGLCVGLGTSIVLIGFQLARENPDLERIGLTAVSALFLSLVGGWFGGQLFPKVYPRRRRRTAWLLES
jgi:hypothetical protein